MEILQSPLKCKKQQNEDEEYADKMSMDNQLETNGNCLYIW